MKSKVFFTDLRVTPQQNIFKKLDKLLVKAEINSIIEKGDLTAIKLHFGEKGNTSYVKPIYLRRIVDKVKSLGGMPFLTDTNTLYVGNRKESVTQKALAECRFLPIPTRCMSAIEKNQLHT